MPVQKITREKVIEAAKSIVKRGYEPTLAEVRAYLGNCGSQTTIHKYLKEWKKTCLESSLKTEMKEGFSSTLLEEKRILEQRLHQYRLQNEQYAKELIQVEKSLSAYKLENQALKKEINQLQEQLKEVSALKSHFESLCKVLQEEREAFYDKELGEKNRLIMLLQEELKAINLQALKEIRDMGYDRDDAVMQEKIKIINLQEKIIKLTEENKSYADELNKVKAPYQKALKKLNNYRNIIEEKVPKEILEQYFEEMMVVNGNQESIL